MQGQLRHNLAGQTDYAQILHDDAVHAHIAQKHEIFGQLLQLAIVHERIHSDIETHMVHMGEIHGLRHFFLIKIAGIGAGAEGLAAHINGICAGIHRRLQGLPATSGSQKLNIFLLHGHLPFAHCG